MVRNMKISVNYIAVKDTGAGYTTTYHHHFYYNIDLSTNKLLPCPVWGRIVKGYTNRRFKYQVISKTMPYIELEFCGSANPSTGPTPEELLNSDIMDHIHIHDNNLLLNASDHKKIMQIILKNLPVLVKDWEYMASNSPGRTCLIPPSAAEKPVMFFKIYGDAAYIALDNIKAYAEKIPEKAPGWVWGFRAVFILDKHSTRSSVAGQRQQGNLILSAIIAPFMSEDKILDEPELITEYSVRGNEGNDHRIIFDSHVYLLYDDDQHPVFYAPEPIKITVKHPQHEKIAAVVFGVFRATHLRDRRE